MFAWLAGSSAKFGLLRCDSPPMTPAALCPLRRYEGKFETSLLRTWASAKSLPLVIKFG